MPKLIIPDHVLKSALRGSRTNSYITAVDLPDHNQRLLQDILIALVEDFGLVTDEVTHTIKLWVDGRPRTKPYLLHRIVRVDGDLGWRDAVINLIQLSEMRRIYERQLPYHKITREDFNLALEEHDVNAVVEIGVRNVSVKLSFDFLLED